MDNFPPNHFQLPDKDTQQKPKSVLKEAAFQIFLRVVGLVLLIAIAWTAIQGLSDAGSSFGAIVMDWLHGASINPTNKHGFKNLLRLILTAAFIGFLIKSINKK